MVKTVGPASAVSEGGELVIFASVLPHWPHLAAGVSKPPDLSNQPMEIIP